MFLHAPQKHFDTEQFPKEQKTHFSVSKVLQNKKLPGRVPRLEAAVWHNHALRAAHSYKHTQMSYFTPVRSVATQLAVCSFCREELLCSPCTSEHLHLDTVQFCNSVILYFSYNQQVDQRGKDREEGITLELVKTWAVPMCLGFYLYNIPLLHSHGLFHIGLHRHC